MSGTSHPVSRSLAQADAVYESKVDTQWRYWRRYLDAQQILLIAQDAAATPLSFEGADDLVAQARQAQDDLDHLPAQQRVLFETVVADYRAQITEQDDEARRAAGSRGVAPDVDQIDREVLDILLTSATGGASSDGRGLVPMTRNDQDEIVWYSVDSALLSSIPDQATYAAVGAVSSRDATNRMLGAGALLIGLILFVIVFVWMLGGVSETAALVMTDPQINDQPVTVWSVTTLVLTDASDHAISLPVQASDAVPPARGGTAQTPTAFWSTTDVWPLALCVVGDESPPDLAALTSVQLRGSGETPDRRYTLQALAPTAPDLILSMCERHGDDTVRYGLLQGTADLVAHAVGDQAMLDASTAITLESIQVIGPGEDASVPDNQQVVVVRVSGADAIDWPRATATLLVADGQRIETPALQRDADTTILRYSSVTLMTTPTEVAWQITHPETGRVVRWRTTLAPPPDRAAVLAQNLVVEQITADPVVAGASLALHLTLSNRGAQPLILTPEDIVMMQGGSRLPTPPSADLREPILTDGRISVTVDVAVDLTQPLTIILGAHRYQITLAAEGG